MYKKASTYVEAFFGLSLRDHSADALPALAQKSHKKPAQAGFLCCKYFRRNYLRVTLSQVTKYILSPQEHFHFLVDVRLHKN